MAWQWVKSLFGFGTASEAEPIQYVQKVEIDSIHGTTHRMVFFKALDRNGVWHNYGPVITTDCEFDCEAHCAVVAEKVAAMVEEAERQGVVW